MDWSITAAQKDVDPNDREIFQSIILDHDTRPRNFRKIVSPTHSAEGYNPICGDRYDVYLTVDAGRISELSFHGYGCAISKASASIMTTVLRGKSAQEASLIFQEFRAMLAGNIGSADGAPELEELAALEGVRRWPVRIACATLAWQAMLAALEGRGNASTE